MYVPILGIHSILYCKLFYFEFTKNVWRLECVVWEWVCVEENPIFTNLIKTLMLGRKILLKDWMKELKHAYILDLGLDTCTYNVQWYMFAL